MATEEREGASGYALIERASELCEQVYGRCIVLGIADPLPRDFTRELLALNLARYANTGHVFPLDVMASAFWYLVPPAER